jgi:hypothetical protein
MELSLSWSYAYLRQLRDSLPFMEPPKVYRHIHMNSPLDPILSDLNPVHTITTYVFNTNFNIILLISA